MCNSFDCYKILPVVWWYEYSVGVIMTNPRTFHATNSFLVVRALWIQIFLTEHVQYTSIIPSYTVSLNNSHSITRFLSEKISLRNQGAFAAVDYIALALSVADNSLAWILSFFVSSVEKKSVDLSLKLFGAFSATSLIFDFINNPFLFYSWILYFTTLCQRRTNWYISINSGDVWRLETVPEWV